MTSLLTDAGRRSWRPSRFAPFTIGTPCGVKGANVSACVGVCTANLVHGNSVVNVLRWVPGNGKTHLPKEKRHCTAGVACKKSEAKRHMPTGVLQGAYSIPKRGRDRGASAGGIACHPQRSTERSPNGAWSHLGGLQQHSQSAAPVTSCTAFLKP